MSQVRTSSSGDFEKTRQRSKAILPIPLPTQNYALIGLAGPSLHTKASSLTLQVNGFFATKQTLIEHMNEMDNKSMTMACVPVDSPFYFGDLSLSPEQQTAFVDQAIEELKKEKKQLDIDLKEYIKKKQKIGKETTGLTELDREDREKAERTAKNRHELQEKLEKTEMRAFKQQKKERKQIVKRMKPNDCVLSQNYAVISIFQNRAQQAAPDEIETQFIVVCYGAFPTMTEAEDYLSDVVQHEREEYDVHYVVQMYKPLRLNDTRCIDTPSKVFKTEVETETWQQRQRDKLSSTQKQFDGCTKADGIQIENNSKD